jgi:hypothetical protein
MTEIETKATVNMMDNRDAICNDLDATPWLLPVYLLLIPSHDGRPNFQEKRSLWLDQTISTVS